MTPSEQWSLLELWERARDGRADQDEEAKLNSLIQADPEARRFLAQAALMDAQLRDLDEEAFLTNHASNVQPAASRFRSWQWHTLTAIAASIVAAGAVWLLNDTPAPVATLAKARSCKWGNSALPTMEGALLPPGMRIPACR